MRLSGAQKRVGRRGRAAEEKEARFGQLGSSHLPLFGQLGRASERMLRIALLIVRRVVRLMLGDGGEAGDGGAAHAHRTHALDGRHARSNLTVIAQLHASRGRAVAATRAAARLRTQQLLDLGPAQRERKHNKEQSS